MADLTPDTQRPGLIGALPAAMRDYALLARFDRPVGIWLLFWPCLAGMWLAGGGVRWELAAWFLLGSAAMRGAGCVWNDVLDADLDRQVARTAARPVAARRVSRKAALVWMGALCLIGLTVLVQLPWAARAVALASLAPVAAYPAMKRITWWPQAWLGLVFGWGALVGWTAVRTDGLEVLAALYAGTALWIVGYDTIYALQDREDDALVGVRSSARRLGRHARGGVALFYTGAVALWALALWWARLDPLALLAMAPLAVHLVWQIATLRPDEPGNALRRFRSNAGAGALLAIACFVVGQA